MARKVLVLAALLLGLGVEAHAAVLCKSKTTKAVFVRAKCKASEKQVQPAALGLPGPGLAVYDANGKKVGDVEDLGGSNVPLVIFHMNDHVFTLRAIRPFLAGTRGLLFKSGDCSGVAFFEFESYPGSQTQAFEVSLLPVTAVGPPGSTVYIPTPNTLSQSIATGSFFSQFDGCLADGSTRTVVPALSIVDLDTLFTPPFSVK